MTTRMPTAQRPRYRAAPVFPRSAKATRETPLHAPRDKPHLPPAPAFNPMLSIGQQLMKARKDRGLTIEDVAFETRIPHQRLRDMENDDLSNFANLTYAKGFLKLYSRYLGLDLSDYLDEFDTSAIAEVTGHEYAHTSGFASSYSGPALTLEQGRSRAAGGWFGLAALLCVLTGTGWLMLRNRPADQDTATPPPAASVSAKPKLPTRTAAEAPENALAKADSAPDSPPPVPEPALRIRRATPVDDDGNEIPRGTAAPP